MIMITITIITYYYWIMLSWLEVCKGAMMDMVSFIVNLQPVSKCREGCGKFPGINRSRSVPVKSETEIKHSNRIL